MKLNALTILKKNTKFKGKEIKNKLNVVYENLNFYTSVGNIVIEYLNKIESLELSRRFEK